ncbi:MAG: DNA polymerase III subunit epsilon [Woeseiaceae bacterium]|nr:DNA polymerase III subunit epsilon [Woeseiaceae bacterium]
MRQIVLDTETTGLATSEGHRVIEIGCVELVNRRITGNNFHTYLNPDRDIDEGAERVHGISRDDLETAPRFPEIVDRLLEYLRDSELVIHNAEFDVGFLDHELGLMEHDAPEITQHASVLDTLMLARKMHPGQRNSLDALCKRYEVDASNRELHGALIDADLLARVYLAMTGGQTAMTLEEASSAAGRPGARGDSRPGAGRSGRAAELDLVVIRATDEEIAAHDALMEQISPP